MAFAGLISDSISTIGIEKTFIEPIKNFIKKNYKHDNASSLNKIRNETF